MSSFDNPFSAWSQLNRIVDEMSAGTVEMTKDAFYARREELDEMAR